MRTLLVVCVALLGAPPASALTLLTPADDDTVTFPERKRLGRATLAELSILDARRDLLIASRPSAAGPVLAVSLAGALIPVSVFPWVPLGITLAPAVRPKPSKLG